MISHLKVVAVMIGMLCLTTFVLDTHAADKVVIQGLADLSARDFNKKGAVALDGEWEFYWDRLISSKEIEPALGPDSFIIVPSTWKGVVSGDEKLPGMGVATYRLTVNIDPGAMHRVWGLKILIMGSAYSMWVNGNQVSANGIVGKDKNRSVPEVKPRVVFFTPGTDQLEIIVQVSNFHHPRGGIWRSILLGPADTIREVYRNRLISDAFFIAAYLMIGLSHFALFLVYRQRIPELYFSCLCFIIALRTGFTGEHLLLCVTGAWNWSFQFITTGLTVVAVLPVFLMFIDKIFPKLYSSVVLKIVQGVGLIYAGLLIFTPVAFWSPLMKIYQAIIVFAMLHLCFVIGKAAVRKVRYARAVLLGCMIVVGTVINDVLLVNHLIETGYMLSYGLILFIIIQSFLLAKTSLNALKEKTILSQRLVQMEKSQNQAMENERFRISRELHDEVAQVFSLIRYQVTSKRNKASGLPLEPLCRVCKDQLEKNQQIVQLSDKGNLKIRQVMNDLYPPELDVFGLSAAVESHILEICQKTGIQVVFKQMKEIPRGEKSKELAVLRIIQEAVSNMIKHSRVNSANVTIGKNDESVWFQVSDEGCGFQFENKMKCSDTGGRGLFFIQERARQIHGTINIHSAPSEGTQIFLMLSISDWCLGVVGRQ